MNLDAERLEALRSAHQADGVRRSKSHSVRVEDYLEVLYELELVESESYVESLSRQIDELQSLEIAIA